MSEIGVIEKWMDIMLNTIVAKTYGPTVTARFQYLVSTIIYYAFITCKNIKNNSLKEPELSFLYTWQKNSRAINYIIQEGMLYLYGKLNIDTSNIGQDTFNTNARTRRVIQNIKSFIDRRDNDNYKNASATIPDEKFPNKNLFIEVDNFTQDLSALDQHTWTPLKHNNGKIQKYLTPFWGNVIPIENMSVSKYVTIADENYDVTNKDANREIEIKEVLTTYENLTDTQKMIAEYFQGGKVSPPGIWNVIALYTIKSTNINSHTAVQFLYLLNATMFMASIVAWNVKYKYMQSRPIQEIRLLTNQQVTTFDGTVVPNKAWKTFQQQDFQTPPFPDYISGHSTFSSGAATIFEQFFPNNFNNINFIPFTSHHGGLITGLLENNNYVNTVNVAMIKNSSSTVVHTDCSLRFPTCAVKLTFNNWRELATLSGMSRVYGGIHGNNSNYAGLIIGECIAKDILNRNNLTFSTPSLSSLSIKNNNNENQTTSTERIISRNIPRGNRNSIYPSTQITYISNKKRNKYQPI